MCIPKYARAGFAAGCSTLLNSPSFPLALGKLMAIVGLFGIIGIVLVYPAVLYLKCCSMYNFTSNENSGSTGGGGGVNDDDGDDHSNGFGGNGQSDGGIATTLIPHPQSPFHSQRSRKSQPLSSPSLVSSLSSSSSSSSSSSRNGLIATNSDAAASSSSTARASAAGSVTRRVGDPTKEQELLVPLVPFYATLHSIWWVVSRVCLGLLGLFARVFKQREEETDAPCTTEIEMDVMRRRSFNNSNTKHNGEGSRGGDSVITISAKKKNKNRGKGEGEGKSDVDQPLHLHMNDSTAVKVFLISYIVASVCLFFLAVYVYIVQ